MKNYSKYIIIGVLLLSVGFFELKGLGRFSRIFELATLGIVVIHFLIFTIYNPVKPDLKANFTLPLVILIFAVILSILPARFFHSQPFLVSFYEQRKTYLILFYFVLFYLKPKTEWILNVIFILAVIVTILHIFQYLLYPVLITDAKIFIQRGAIRINMPGTIFRHFAFFYSLDRFFASKEKKYLIAGLLMLGATILSAYRSTLVVYLLIMFFYILFSKEVKSKLGILIMAAVFVVVGFFSFQNIIQEMMDSAEKEAESGTGNIRYRAANQFLTEESPDKLTYLIGNGQPSFRTAYGRRHAFLALRYGYYISDIGIIGYFYRFGAVAVLSILIIYFRMVIMKYPISLISIRLFIIYQLLVSLNTVIPFDAEDGIILMTLLLYIVDVERASLNNENPV
jgi:hypothetical protein